MCVSRSQKFWLKTEIKNLSLMLVQALPGISLDMQIPLNSGHFIVHSRCSPRSCSAWNCFVSAVGPIRSAGSPGPSLSTCNEIFISLQEFICNRLPTCRLSWVIWSNCCKDYTQGWYNSLVPLAMIRLVYKNINVYLQGRNIEQGLLVRRTVKAEVMWVRTNGGDAEPSGAVIGPHNVNNMMSHLFMTQ